MTNQVRTTLWWFAASSFLGLSVGLLSEKVANGWGIFFAALALGMFMKTFLVYVHGAAYTPSDRKTTLLDAIREEEGKNVQDNSN